MKTHTSVRGLLLMGSVASCLLSLPSSIIGAHAQTVPSGSTSMAMAAAQGASPSILDAMPSCAAERRAVDAASSRPGTLLVEARTDLAACEGKAAP